MSNDDDSAWKDAVRPKVVSGPAPSSVNTIKNNSGLWQPDMTLFNFEQIQKASLAKLGMVTVSENKNATNHSNNLDQTGDTSDVMTQQLQQSAENAKNDSLATDNNSTVNKVDAFQSIESFQTKFVFPYNTAENVNTYGIFIQPYSALVGIATVFLIFYYLLKTKTTHGFLLIFSILVFELFHSYSHINHFNSIETQTKIVHSLTIFVNLSLLYALSKYSNKDISKIFVLFISCVVIADFYALNNLSIRYYIVTQLIILFSIIFYYLKSINKILNTKLLFVLFLIIYLGFINETINGKYLLNNYPNFPFHAVLEILLFVFFYVLCSSLYKI
uniref:Uncharacterized protein n=1 Tax=viral metagenome TaxID=1070528 RepID=A0A6C0AWE4_9ZZZZ|tara:strand:- start:17918 stop:18910 length:993 start_codon:yes stop_codon:yes gene_type:complete